MCRPTKETDTVYRAEYDALYMAETKFTDIRQCQGFLDEVLNDSWWRARFRIRHVRLEKRRQQDCAIAYPGMALILLPKWAMKDWIIIHELVHLVVQVDNDPHGVNYRTMYLQLVARYVSPLAAKELRAHFREHKLKVAA